MQSYFLTDRGKVRAHNEDAGGIFRNPYDQQLVIIADGMGGHQAGDVASRMTVELFRDKWEKGEKIPSQMAAEAWLRETVKEVNESIHAYSLTHEGCEGMGTTVVATILTDSILTICHVGDSRGYLFNENGFSQITHDHSLVNELVRSGEITQEDAENHPRKNVLLQALGTEQTIDEDIRTISWETGDTLLLCSDGLSNKVSDEELEQMIAGTSQVESAATSLIKLANNRGGEDNITVVIVKQDGERGDQQ